MPVHACFATQQITTCTSVGWLCQLKIYGHGCEGGICCYKCGKRNHVARKGRMSRFIAYYINASWFIIRATWLGRHILCSFDLWRSSIDTEMTSRPHSSAYSKIFRQITCVLSQEAPASDTGRSLVYVFTKKPWVSRQDVGCLLLRLLILDTGRRRTFIPSGISNSLRCCIKNYEQ